jgi:hypothetical protein
MAIVGPAARGDVIARTRRSGRPHLLVIECSISTANNRGRSCRSEVCIPCRQIITQWNTQGLLRFHGPVVPCHDCHQLRRFAKRFRRRDVHSVECGDRLDGNGRLTRASTSSVTATT